MKKAKVKQLEKAGWRVGSTADFLELSPEESALIDTIKKLNIDDEVDGILVQLPLPKQISEEKIIIFIGVN